jgi:hypothetical protein
MLEVLLRQDGSWTALRDLALQRVGIEVSADSSILSPEDERSWPSLGNCVSYVTAGEDRSSPGRKARLVSFVGSRTKPREQELGPAGGKVV